jgi:hypothetical protein
MTTASTPRRTVKVTSTAGYFSAQHRTKSRMYQSSAAEAAPVARAVTAAPLGLVECGCKTASACGAPIRPATIRHVTAGAGPPDEATIAAVVIIAHP